MDWRAVVWGALFSTDTNHSTAHVATASSDYTTCGQVQRGRPTFEKNFVTHATHRRQHDSGCRHAQNSSGLCQFSNVSLLTVSFCAPCTVALHDHWLEHQNRNHYCHCQPQWHASITSLLFLLQCCHMLHLPGGRVGEQGEGGGMMVTAWWQNRRPLMTAFDYSALCTASWEMHHWHAHLCWVNPTCQLSPILKQHKYLFTDNRYCSNTIENLKICAIWLLGWTRSQTNVLKVE